MQFEKYKNKLENIKISEPDEKLLNEISHTLTIRQKDFKTFLLSDQETSIAHENDFNEIESLKNYERTLNAGKNGN